MTVRKGRQRYGWSKACWPILLSAAPSPPLSAAAVSPVADNDLGENAGVDGGGGGEWETIRCRMFEVSTLLPAPGGDPAGAVPPPSPGGGSLPDVEDGWRCVVLGSVPPNLLGDEYAPEAAYDVVPGLPSRASDLLLLGAGAAGGWDGTMEIRGASLDSVRYELTPHPEAEFRLIRGEGLFRPARREGHLRAAPSGSVGGANGLGAAGGEEAQAALGALERAGGGGGALKKSGISTVLILRVCDPDSCPPFTAEEASDAVFGTRGDRANLVSQYDLCSSHKLRFTPATGNGIIGGVMDVRLSESVEGKTRTAAENMAADAAVELLHSLSRSPRKSLDRIANHCLFALPPNTAGNWNTEGYYNWYRTVFNKDKILFLSYQMHEVGHNLNLRHSGLGKSIYGDTSGYQGYTYANDDTPRMCFNPAKSWESGWYSDRQQTVDLLSKGGSAGAAIVRLVGVVDYELGKATLDRHIVVVRIPDRHNYVNGGSVDDLLDMDEEVTALYVMFNRAKGFNDQTRDFADAVTVVRAGPPNVESGDGDFNTHVTSYAVGALSFEPSEKKKGRWRARSAASHYFSAIYKEENFDGTTDVGGGHALVIELCEINIVEDESSDIPDVATIVIRLEGVHNLSCTEAVGTNKEVAVRDDAIKDVLSEQIRDGGSGREEKPNKDEEKVSNESNNDGKAKKRGGKKGDNDRNSPNLNRGKKGAQQQPCEDKPRALATLNDRTLSCHDLATHALELLVRARRAGNSALGERRSRRFRRNWCVLGTAAKNCRSLCGPWISACKKGRTKTLEVSASGEKITVVESAAVPEDREAGDNAIRGP
uniref:Peptidase M11 gametolysin domain-containing protein n=1 Tax=Odontella aurita TaxID=265563 RepID=A0A7S4JK83_9STRA|mmetsp:Transcript_47853/g.144740  ORF Transcript_47853/g.144740 Transcript_47853/m.144740 type:complete len:822 (+) Transcript_47853:23-2488(+)